MPHSLDAIRERVSVRTYSEISIEPEKRDQLSEYIEGNCTGPFGGVSRIAITDISNVSKKEMKEYKTYGIIKGAKTYIIGTLRKGAAFEDFGYVFENVVLKATELGLGTCWMGGTFKRSGFAKAVGLEETEILCAVSPLGYAASKRRFAENTLRSFAGSAKRLPFENLFFVNPELTPMIKQEAGIIGEVLEYVRIGPSASNKQPWRIVTTGNRCHFFLARSPSYPKNLGLLGGFDLQRSDIGIAMCHFECAIKALDPNHTGGGWVKEDPNYDSGFEYIATWIRGSD